MDLDSTTQETKQEYNHDVVTFLNKLSYTCSMHHIATADLHERHAVRHGHGAAYLILNALRGWCFFWMTVSGGRGALHTSKVSESKLTQD
jgi:hypothetical protein